jgi:UDP-N-acetylglucosamine 2-epimerase (non-hydrolysing)
MAAFDATPLHRKVAATAAATLLVVLFWGGPVGRVDASGRADTVACSVGIGPDGSVPRGDARVVLRWERVEWRRACDSGNALPGAHEGLVSLLSSVGSYGLGPASLDLRWLALGYVVATALAVGALVRRLAAHPATAVLAGVAVLIVVADGSVSPSFISLDPRPVVVLGLLVTVTGLLGSDRPGPVPDLGILGGGVLLATTLPAPAPAIAVLTVAASARAILADGSLLRRSVVAAARATVVAAVLGGAAVLTAAGVGTNGPTRPVEEPAGLVERHRAAAAAVLSPRDVGDGLPAEPPSASGARPAATCRVCVVSNLGPLVADTAWIGLPLAWVLMARTGMVLVRRGRRCRDDHARALGESVVAIVVLAAALQAAAVVDGRAGDPVLVTVASALGAALLIPGAQRSTVLGRQLGARPGLVRRIGHQVAQWLVVPGPAASPAPAVAPVAVPVHPARLNPAAAVVVPRPAWAGRDRLIVAATGARPPLTVTARHDRRRPAAWAPAARHHGRDRRPELRCAGRAPPRGPPRHRRTHRSSGSRLRAPPTRHRLIPDNAPRSAHRLALPSGTVERTARAAGPPTAVPRPLTRRPMAPTLNLTRPLVVAVVLGTRPEAIKLAPVARALLADPRSSAFVVHTGQHTALAADVLEAFDIVPDARLDLLRAGQGLVQLLGRAVTSIGEVLVTASPDVVVVQGDTTTAAAAALAATQLAIPVAHVEAGLRSHDRAAPFPEEDNRRIIGAVADLHLPPTDAARQNLLAEGVDPDAIVVTGNTGIDALDTVLAAGSPAGDRVVERVRAHPGRVVLVTAHRRESWGTAMDGIARAIHRVVDAEPDVLVVLPLHPNPVVRDVLLSELGGHPRVDLCEPLSYASLAHVLASSALVLTDSGGIQEEAPHLGVPTLVLRSTTERPEGVEAGAAWLVGVEPDTIVHAARVVLHEGAVRRSMGRPRHLYGDGRAAGRAVDAIAHRHGLGARPDEFVADNPCDQRPRRV